MFRAGLLLVIRRMDSVQTAIGTVNITLDHTNCCLYRVDSPDNEQQACSKHVVAYYRNNLIENSTSCWLLLYDSIVILCY